MQAKQQRVTIERRMEDLSRWRFSRTISLDSLIVLVVTVLSGIVFILTISAKQEQQARDLSNVQELVKRIEADQKERTARIERDQAERSQRLELAIKEQGLLIQSLMVPRLQR